MPTKHTIALHLIGDTSRNTVELAPNTLLRNARKQQRWTQKEVAEKIGVAPLSVGRWERGEVIPHAYARTMLCKLFHKSTQELGLADEKETPDPEESPLPMHEGLATGGGTWTSQLAEKAPLKPLLSPVEVALYQEPQPAEHRSTGPRELDQNDTSALRNHSYFSRRVNYERVRRGWSQAQLAEQLGCDFKTVSRWESGQRVPLLYFQQKLCQLFGMNGYELGLQRPDEAELSLVTRSTFALHMPIPSGDCEQPALAAQLDTIVLDPRQGQVKFYLQFTNGTTEDVGLKFEELSLLDPIGDFFLGQSVGSLFLSAQHSCPVAVVFDCLPRAGTVYRLSLVLTRPKKWRNAYQPMALKF